MALGFITSEDSTGIENKVAQSYADGIVVTDNVDGYAAIAYADGIVVTDNVNGYAAIAYADGIVVTDNVNGYAAMAYAKGIVPYQLTRVTRSPQRTQAWTG